jgi:dihydropyrimidinase
MTTYDLVIRGGQVVTPDGVILADVAAKAGKIAAIGPDLRGAEEIDVQGRLVLPGGVDPHAHIEQMSGMGLMNADDFESATRSAALGGTTTVISFAAQAKGQGLRATVADYAARAARGAAIDHAFHLTITDLAVPGFAEDLAALIAAGHHSVKLFTTYNIGLTDAAILEVMAQVKAAGGLVCVHAENDGLIGWAKSRLLAAGLNRPEDHALSHPRLAEVEALERMCRFAEFFDQPVMLFHISTAEGVGVVRAAQARGAPVWAETCVHYLLQTAEVLQKPGVEGAKWMCSPPQRETADQEALWQGLEGGEIALISSDHAPYRFDASGKLLAGAAPPFDKIANGLPGLETRLPLLFDAMVTKGRGGLSGFVKATAQNPADLYGLAGKGRIAMGADADLVVWNPQRKATYGANDLADNTGYNPWEGYQVTGWPEEVVLAGKPIVRAGTFIGRPGAGKWRPRFGGTARALGNPSAEYAFLRDKGAL